MKNIRKVAILMIAELALTIIAMFAIMAVSVKTNNDALGYASFILIGTLIMEVIPIIALLTVLENEDDEKDK